MAKPVTRRGKFPPTPEIKRVISAALSTGVDIAAIDIRPTHIRIQTIEGIADKKPISAYDVWKARQEPPDKNS